MFVTLRMNLLISIVLGTRKYFTGKHKILVSIYASIAEAIGNAFFYLIQVCSLASNAYASLLYLLSTMC